MTATSYKKLKQALIQLKRLVTSSPEAASRFIDELGLRDIIIDERTPSQKATPKTTNSRRKKL